VSFDFHSFAGGVEMARSLLPLASWFGVSGMVTFPKADNVRDVLATIPRDRLLVETDTPYLAPVPYRGKRNEPAYVVEVADRLARELALPPRTSPPSPRPTSSLCFARPARATTRTPARR
jgi:TatD DNase family protein